VRVIFVVNVIIGSLLRFVSFLISFYHPAGAVLASVLVASSGAGDMLCSIYIIIGNAFVFFLSSCLVIMRWHFFLTTS